MNHLSSYIWSPKTLSFWLMLLGFGGLAARQRWAAHFLLAVGWGGAGGAYFRVAHREQIPVHPGMVIPELTPDDIRAILSHAMLIVPGILALRRKDG